MANTPLTSTVVTREALRILHEKLSFIGTLNRQHDNRFAQSGAKIGDSLLIRLPNEYTVRTGKTLNAQDTAEISTTLTVATQNGVDLNFSSAELTLEIDDFSSRILEPAMAVLASHIESTVLQGVTQDVADVVGTSGTPPNDLLEIGLARARLNQNLAPKQDRHIQMNSGTTAGVVNGVNALFHDSTQIAKQYREGYIGQAIGFKWHENDRTYVHANGSDVTGATLDTYTVTEADVDLTVTGLSAAPSVGTVFTLADVYAVHPETKVAYSHLKQFVVTAATTTVLTIDPPIYLTGARQNVSATPATTASLVFVGAATTPIIQDLAYHKDVATFATADLQMPSGVDFAAREVYDGVSMRIVRDFDINNDNFPCRVDVLWGYKTIRPQLGVRITN